MIYKPSDGVKHKNGKTWDPAHKLSKAKYEPKKEKTFADEKHIEKDIQWNSGRNGIE